jgi:uncharacterized membrane protein YidH (DUF202 family)
LLAWVRTGINAIGAGILLYTVAGATDALSSEAVFNDVKVPYLDNLALFGVVLAVFGVFAELIAGARFVQYRMSLGRGYFTSSAPVYILVAFGLTFLGVAFIIYTVVA